MKMYLIIQTGYEGIEKLCYLTDNAEEAKSVKQKEIDEEMAERKERNESLRKEGFSPAFLEMGEQDASDFFCIQEWDGKEFQCVCDKLGVAPSRLMLR